MGTVSKQGTEKVALVTGAGAGIGRGIAKVLAEKGYRLAMTYNSSKEGIVDVAEDIGHTYGKEPLIIQSDLTVRSEAENTIRKTIEEFGRIDLLVNNAGIGLYDELTEIEEDALDMTVHLDFRAPMLLSKYAVREMVAQGIPAISSSSRPPGRESLSQGQHLRRHEGGAYTCRTIVGARVGSAWHPRKLRGTGSNRSQAGSIGRGRTAWQKNPVGKARHALGHRGSDCLALLGCGILHYRHQSPYRRRFDLAGHAGGYVPGSRIWMG